MHIDRTAIHSAHRLHKYLPANQARSHNSSFPVYCCINHRVDMGYSDIRWYLEKKLDKFVFNGQYKDWQ